MYGCMHCLDCTSDCVCRCGGDVICVGHDLNRCSGWWYVSSVNVEYRVLQCMFAQGEPFGRTSMVRGCCVVPSL